MAVLAACTVAGRPGFTEMREVGESDHFASPHQPSTSVLPSSKSESSDDTKSIMPITPPLEKAEKEKAEKEKAEKEKAEKEKAEKEKAEKEKAEKEKAEKEKAEKEKAEKEKAEMEKAEKEKAEKEKEKEPREVEVSGRIVRRESIDQLVPLSDCRITPTSGPSTAADSDGRFRLRLTLANGSGGDLLTISRKGFWERQIPVCIPTATKSDDLGDIILYPNGHAPVIEVLDPQPNRVFLKSVGKAIKLPIRFRVAWNGLPRDGSKFLVDQKADVAGLDVCGVYTADVIINDTDFKGRPDALREVPIQLFLSNGKQVSTTATIGVVALPEFLAKLAPSKGIPMSAEGEVSFHFDYTSPDQLKDLNILGKYGVHPHISGFFVYRASGEWILGIGSGAFDAMGRRGRRPHIPALTRHPELKLYLGNQQIDLTGSALAEGIYTPSGGFVFNDLGGELAVNYRGELTRISPLSAAPVLQPVVKQIPILESALRTVSIIVWGEVHGGGQVMFHLNPEFGLDSLSVKPKVGVTAEYAPPPVFGQTVLFYVGANGSVEVSKRTDDWDFAPALTAEAGFNVDLWGFRSAGVVKLLPHESGPRTEKRQVATWSPIADPPPPARLASAATPKSQPSDSTTSANLPTSERVEGHSEGAGQVGAMLPPVIEGAWRDASPALAVHGQERMLLFVQGSGANDAQFTQVAASFFDGQQWAAPVPVSPRTTGGQFAPQVRFTAQGDAIAVWHQIRQASPSAANPGDLAEAMEIAWARWDRHSKAWTGAQFLTENRLLDDAPRLAGPLSNGALILAWRQSSGLSAESGVLCRRFQQDAWTPEEEILPRNGYLQSLSLAARDGTACVAWSRDQDGKPETVHDQELAFRKLGLASSIWDNALQLTNNAADQDVQVQIGHGEIPQFVWNRVENDKSVWMSVDASGVNPRKIDGPDGHEVAFAVNEAGDGIIAWHGWDKQIRGPVVRVFDHVSGSWGGPKSLADDGKGSVGYALTPAWNSKGEFVMAYCRRALSKFAGAANASVGNEPAPLTANLALAQKTLVHDLAVTRVDVSTSEFDYQDTAPLNLAPGDEVTLSATIQNAGDFSGDDIKVEFYYTEEGNNSTRHPIQTQSLGTLAAAEATTSEAKWMVPERWVARTLEVRVIDGRKGMADSNPANDRITRLLNDPKAPVLRVEYKSGSVIRERGFLNRKQTTRIVATVHNDGWTNLTGAGEVLQMGTAEPDLNGLKDSDPLPILFNENNSPLRDVPIPALKPGESTDIVLVPDLKLASGTETVFYLRALRPAGEEADDQVRFWLSAPEDGPFPWRIVGIAIGLVACVGVCGFAIRRRSAPA
jgi:hypothetical protein